MYKTVKYFVTESEVSQQMRVLIANLPYGDCSGFIYKHALHKVI